MYGREGYTRANIETVTIGATDCCEFTNTLKVIEKDHVGNTNKFTLLIFSKHKTPISKRHNFC